MATTRKQQKTCAAGHRFTKSSDCPTCPVCEALRAPKEGLLAGVAAPARRALARAGISTVHELAKFSEAELLAMHGMGPSTLPKLRKALEAAGLTFRADD